MTKKIISPVFWKKAVKRRVWCFLKTSSISFCLESTKIQLAIIYHSFLFKIGLSASKKHFLICFNDSPSTMMKNGFYFILKALFVLKIFKFMSWLICHVEKRTWLEIFWDLWLHSLVNKELQYAFRSLSHELKATRQWKFGPLIEYAKINIFFKNHSENGKEG